MIFWADKLGKQVIERENKLKRTKILRVESGIGASGIPHLGSASDAVRAWAVCLAIRDQGKNSELIAFSDDRDGLRKVPSGFPTTLKSEIGKPVSLIKDPFSCHASYSEHMSSLLIDALDRLGIEYKFQSGNVAYAKGMLDKQIDLALKNSDSIKKVIKDMLGQELVTVFFPICQRCERIYTTRVTGYENGKIIYSCDGEFEGKVEGKPLIVKGCGYKGECTTKDGKLAWKVEFAARWAALKICFEAYGKDIADSVRVNDWVSKNIFGWEPPIHAQYELFLQKSGAKISKSVGNVITPQQWLTCASPQSLNLLFYKRFVGTREIDLSSIPVYMDEVDRLERIWFGEEKVQNERELAHLKRLFEYINYLNPPKKPHIHIAYHILANIARITQNKEIIRQILIDMGKIEPGKESQDVEKRIEWVINWIGKQEKEKVKIGSAEAVPLFMLAEWLEKERSAEEIQGKIFELAKSHGIQPPKLFELVYAILLGSTRGPRAGKLIKILGCKKVSEEIKKALSGPAGI
ncbi:MAG: lysine--tRNA ligase [Candidatus Aenigmatarchaeota archaeon]